MGKKSYSKSKGRKRSSKQFMMLFYEYLDSENYIRLSPRSKVLLFDIARQYNGKNNGDLCVSMTLMKKRGWASSSALQASIIELKHYGWIKRSRKGGQNLAALYAITWENIDECAGKNLEIITPQSAPNIWKNTIPKFEKPKRKEKYSTPELIVYTNPPPTRIAKSFAGKIRFPTPQVAQLMPPVALINC